MKRNCICIKWGSNAYSADDVNRVFRSAQMNSTLPINMYCVTDDAQGILPEITHIPLSTEPFHATMQEAAAKATKKDGALRKIGLFRPGLIPDLQGPLLVLDLDIIITGDIGPLFDFNPDMICMPPPFARRTKPATFGEGSVILFDPSRHGFLYDEMAKDAARMVAFCGGSEQSYTSGLAQKYGMLANYPKSLVVSFKRHCCWPSPLSRWITPRLQSGTSVVCFHGHPKAAEALQGYDDGKGTRALPSSWLTDAWSKSNPSE